MIVKIIQRLIIINESDFVSNMKIWKLKLLKESILCVKKSKPYNMSR